mmetsp:Transcript_19386/g.55794  ORF Transcript_19386/g.55794 Transcript_19386/m.55794 type:complete len:218 (+) Transcript_19386:184-837(+)|eukprot:CAMPEP_0181021676 /NCGR_PEP_ID=MMETSP1070-20121207/1107_1 /TAXON_ID=265543 /ORGANISM="Minutocellus polymorphus, Strain NH13" /LENGTH=217 /DNA_ID=CAMNT_0023098565 /DNA_START=167 /DNA_END=820 /DNA_ORIENTATION=-
MTPERLLLALIIINVCASFVAIVLACMILRNIGKLRGTLSTDIGASLCLPTDGRNGESVASAVIGVAKNNMATEGKIVPKIQVAKVPQSAVVPGFKVHKWSVNGVKVPPGRELENHAALADMGDFLAFLGIGDPSDNASLSDSHAMVQVATYRGIADWISMSVEDRLTIAKIVRFELRIAARLQPVYKTLGGLEMVNDFVERHAPEFGLEPKVVYLD